jgi:hypothetical protein
MIPRSWEEVDPHEASRPGADDVQVDEYADADGEAVLVGRQEPNAGAVEPPERRAEVAGGSQLVPGRPQ